MPRPIERDLESQAHRETREEAAQAEMLAAIDRTLSNEDKEAFYALGDPSISAAERAARIERFNERHAGTPDAEEPIEGRAQTVSINLANTILSVSRDARGKFRVG